GGFKDHLPEQCRKLPRGDRNRQPDDQADESNGTLGPLANELSRGDLPRPSVRAGKDQLKAREAMTNGRHVKPVAAMDHDAGYQRIDLNQNNVGAPLELPLQRREISIVPLPAWDFDTNSVRRQVDHEGPAPCIHACSSEGFQPAWRSVSADF